MTVPPDAEGALAKTWYRRSVITMEDFSREDIELVFAIARSLGRNRRDRRDTLPLSGSILGALFFQPSTRTRLSFETAMLRLGGTVSGFADAAVTRAGDFYKETLEDVVRFVSELVDVLVLRHFETGAATRAAERSPQYLCSTQETAMDNIPHRQWATCLPCMRCAVVSTGSTLA